MMGPTPITGVTVVDDSVDRAGDAGLARDEVSVHGSHLGEELAGEAATLDPDLVGRADAPQLESRPRR